MGGRAKLTAGLNKGFKFSPEMVRRRLSRIDFDKIVQRLEDEATSDGPMTTIKLQASALLLDRVAPKLSATELSGEVAHPTVVRAPKVQDNSKAWLSEHAPARPDAEPPPKPGEIN